eukprot:gene15871-biopygen8201
MLPELFESFDSDTDRAPSGVLEFSELSGRISQELNFWGVPGQRLAPGQGAGGAWPGPRRQPAARGHHDDCIPGYWRPKKSKKLPCVFELRFEIRRHPDTTWLFYSNFQCKTGTPCWPRAAAEPGSASAEAGQSVGQSHCRAWQQLAAARGHHGGCIPGVLAAKNLKKMTMRLRTQI